jgi:ABC-type Fe2+-enterobactin transport system substrate-binding protein
VNQDRKIAACISTSGGKTGRGKHAVGKLLKLRSDTLFLLLAKDPEKRIILLTESDMLDVCSKEKAGGRVPQEIEFVLAELPDDLRKKLTQAREKASKEVSPGSDE